MVFHQCPRVRICSVQGSSSLCREAAFRVQSTPCSGLAAAFGGRGGNVGFEACLTWVQMLALGGNLQIQGSCLMMLPQNCCDKVRGGVLGSTSHTVHQPSAHSPSLPSCLQLGPVFLCQHLPCLLDPSLGLLRAGSSPNGPLMCLPSCPRWGLLHTGWPHCPLSLIHI